MTHETKMANARRHLLWQSGLTGVACKAPCVGNRGVSGKAKRRTSSYERQRRQHDAAALRHVTEQERVAAQRHAAAALSELESRWGTRGDALDRLGHLERTIGRLQREQEVLRSERDELIGQLRHVGESWNALAARTGLSRQALSQRITDAKRRTL